MASDRVGWTRGIRADDPYSLLMECAADLERRADTLDAAMETVEAEIGLAGFADDGTIRAASWADRMRAQARHLRESAEALRPAAMEAPDV